MGQVAVGALPEHPIDAAATFYARVVPQARSLLSGGAGSVVLVLPPAGPDHVGWRQAAIQSLAREAAPARVNAVIGNDPLVIDRTIAWLETADAITGQCFTLDGAGEPIVP